MDTLATKEERAKAGGSFDGHTTLRRTISKHNSLLVDTQKGRDRRQHVDSGYSTCDGMEKRWSQEMAPGACLQQSNEAKWSPTPIHIRTANADTSSGSTTPALLSPGQDGIYASATNDDGKRVDSCDSEKRNFNNGSNSNRYKFFS